MKIKPISVTELNQYVKNKIANDEFLNSVFVAGEISNFKHHYTGHMYFTLKDENSLIKCVMFKSATGHLNFIPKDGMKVNVLGSIGVFERDGVYQIYVQAMQEDGLGNLYTKYEQLKEKLEKEGLFAQEHKKKIPFMPKVIGVLTSNTGAVIRDIINVSTRRNPNVYLRLLPIPVQGEGASQKIAEAIQLMNEKKLADVIILARGGGSLEDLWPFNEEIVARSIYASELPIVSSVGHETDFTIADFVADLRAPTPSAAAELVVADVQDLKNTITVSQNRLKISLKRKTQWMRLKLEKCMNSIVYKEPYQKLNNYYLEISRLAKQMENATQNRMQAIKMQLAKESTKLDALSPLKTLSRGYCIAEENEKIIASAKNLQVDMQIDLKFQDGKAKAKIVQMNLSDKGV